MKGMDNNAPHGFMVGEEDGYAQMMLMGGAGQQGYGEIPMWMGGAGGGFPGEWEDFQHQ